MRYAVRVDADTLLACPEIPRGVPRAVRVQAYEYILRRQPVLAMYALEAATADSAEQRAARLGVLLSEKWAA